jgi:signal transduction histidine kinase
MQNSFYLYQDMLMKTRKSSNNLMQFTPFGYMWVRLNSKKLVASHSIYSMLEKEPFSEFFTVDRWKSFVHPKDLFKLIQAEEELLYSGLPTVAEYRLITQSGRHIFVEHHMYLSGSSSERKIMSIIQDVTEQKTAAVIVDAMNKSFFELDENFAFRRINEDALKFWRLEHKELVGQKLTTVLPQIDGTDFYDTLSNAMTKKISISREVTDPVTKHWLTLSVTPYADGLVVIFTDIQHEKETEQELQKTTKNYHSLAQENLRLKEERQVEDALGQSEQKLRELNASLELQIAVITAELVKQQNILKQAEEIAQAGSWDYNVKTKEFLWSDGMYRLFEMNKDEPVSPSVYLNYSLEDDLPAARKIVDGIETRFESFEEIMRIKFNGSYKTLRIKAAPLKNNKGEIEKMLGVDLDITQMQRSEEKIKELNRSLSATNRELNSLNTELKTFTNIAANNYSETLRHLYINLELIVTNDARNLSNSGRANLRRAQGAIQKMKLVTDDLISFSRLHEIGTKETDVDLNVILEKVIDDFRKQPGHPLMKIDCDHLPPVNGYPLLLSLLFHHLMDNAIKFRKVDKGHVVNVTCKESVNGNDITHSAVERNSKYHVISVEDNGIGFPQTESERIFEMFFRLNERGKYKGSGTGLALCKKIMEMHGGFITAEGVPDEGASFHCYFPA